MRILAVGKLQAMAEAMVANRNGGSAVSEEVKMVASGLRKRDYVRSLLGLGAKA